MVCCLFLTVLLNKFLGCWVCLVRDGLCGLSDGLGGGEFGNCCGSWWSILGVLAGCLDDERW